jgi:hypothetical protein
MPWPILSSPIHAHYCNLPARLKKLPAEEDARPAVGGERGSGEGRWKRWVSGVRDSINQAGNLFTHAEPRIVYDAGGPTKYSGRWWAGFLYSWFKVDATISIIQRGTSEKKKPLKISFGPIILIFN